MARVVLAAVILMVMLVGVGRPALAHPHVWIDIRVALLFDANGYVTGLRQLWLADEMYSAFATEGLDSDGDGQPDPEALNALLAENLKNLKDYGYFTAVGNVGGWVETSEVRVFSSHMRGRRLAMVFDLPLAEPVDPRDGELRFTVYDPSYFISVRHVKTDDAVDLAGAPEGCDWHVGKPPATAFEIAMAAAVDRNGQLPNGMGEIFAETVTITCAR